MKNPYRKREVGVDILKSEARSARIVAATRDDVHKIVAMINDEAGRSGAVLKVTADEVEEWINGRRSFIAKTTYGKIVGHSAAKIWPESGWAEHRAVVVLQEYRCNGINARLTQAIVQSLEEVHPGITILSLKNGAGIGTVVSFGFKKIPVSEIPDEILRAKGKAEYEAYVFKTLARSRDSEFIVLPDSCDK
ncbi:MAG: GNAT family N-acetyltransferase [Candidatus Marsarchaeota archaeon]|nr:GNAT family N-acetyltransferase [Candidatus Marsarchaeota archaeon]MCL5413234.1 GNAT family N-acetyltransferase [Candidatus Marsarchaeota archaeon]